MAKTSCKVYVAHMRRPGSEYVNTNAPFVAMDCKLEDHVSTFAPGCRIWAVPPEIVKASDEGRISTAIIDGILASPSLPTGPATLGDHLVAGRFYIAF